MLKYVFENTDINRIYAEPFSPNKASKCVLEKCGFTHEATFRESGLIGGEFVDGECYAILRDEYIEG
jgi:RimJ/RimL family protein N-acetyltransferase